MNVRKVSIFLCTALVLFTGRAIAQNASGTIVGHVKDPNGAAIVAAQVSVTNLDTHDVRTVSTNGAGDYTVPLLQPGRYQVTVTANGFKSETEADIVLNVDQTVRIVTQLTVGSATEIGYGQHPDSRAGYGLRKRWRPDRKRRDRRTSSQRTQLPGSNVPVVWGSQQRRR